jgi:hypothetical protein
MTINPIAHQAIYLSLPRRHISAASSRRRSLLASYQNHCQLFTAPVYLLQHHSPAHPTDFCHLLNTHIHRPLCATWVLSHTTSSSPSSVTLGTAATVSPHQHDDYLRPRFGLVRPYQRMGERPQWDFHGLESSRKGAEEARAG